MHGILLVNKPAGITSHDVVAQIRKLFRTKKVGHAGTLDPFATGLLILCLGDATRIVEYLVNGEKEYVAVMKLGDTTDTQDCTGRVLDIRAVPDLKKDALLKVFGRFVGEIAQTPPMFSARKVQGTRLYELARKGEIIERPAKNVTIHALEILEISLPLIRFRVECSKGTYIRTLAHDIGEMLGCGAHVSALERTRIGHFSIKEAYALEQLAQITEQAEQQRCLIPLDQALPFLPAVTLSDSAAALLAHGTPLLLQERDIQQGLLNAPQDQAHQEVRVYRPDGTCIALARIVYSPDQVQRQWRLQPLKVFASGSPESR